MRYHSDWRLLSCYVAFCILVVSVFTAAERRGFRFLRTGFFDVGIKARLKVIKDKSLLIRACFLPLQFGLPLLLTAAVMVRGEVPGYLSAVAAGFVGAILIVRLMRWQWVNTVLRVALYLTVPMVLSLGEVAPADWVKPGMLTAYNYAFGALALFTVMTLMATHRQKGFKATFMDFLILVIALVVPNLPDNFISGLGMGDIAVKTIVMFFSFEVLTGELRGELRKIALGMLAAFVLLAVRGIV